LPLITILTGIIINGLIALWKLTMRLTEEQRKMIRLASYFADSSGGAPIEVLRQTIDQQRAPE